MWPWIKKAPLQGKKGKKDQIERLPKMRISSPHISGKYDECCNFPRSMWCPKSRDLGMFIASDSSDSSGLIKNHRDMGSKAISPLFHQEDIRNSCPKLGSMYVGISIMWLGNSLAPESLREFDGIWIPTAHRICHPQGAKSRTAWGYAGSSAVSSPIGTAGDKPTFCQHTNDVPMTYWCFRSGMRE